jgi:hypothetical protein
MSVELETAWTVATHLAELVAAHGLVEAGKQPARAVLAWLRDHLPEADQPALAAVAQNPETGPARAALALQINTLLTTHPDLLTEIRALLAESKGADSSQHQTVGDNSTAYQIRGNNNTITR